MKESQKISDIIKNLTTCTYVKICSLFYSQSDDEGCMVCEANVNSTCVLLDLLE